MQLNKIKNITDKNIDRIIDENLYRGFVHKGQRKIEVQCMDKDVTVIFDFVEEEAVIIDKHNKKYVWIESMNPKRMANKIYKATC